MMCYSVIDAAGVDGGTGSRGQSRTTSERSDVGSAGTVISTGSGERSNGPVGVPSITSLTGSASAAERSKVSLSQRIRKALVTGPATVGELAVELRIANREAQIGLWVLQKQQFVKSIGRVDNQVSGPGKHRRVLLFSLTPRGRAITKRKGNKP